MLSILLRSIVLWVAVVLVPTIPRPTHHPVLFQFIVSDEGIRRSAFDLDAVAVIVPVPIVLDGPARTACTSRLDGAYLCASREFLKRQILQRDVGDRPLEGLRHY